uniref:Uncharacterized protein n=1 Tax=Arundo donax TaxID=35708 RepID=A0A0A9HTQ2_ARUDO
MFLFVYTVFLLIGSKYYQTVRIL